MADWTSASSVAKQALVLDKLDLIMFGIFLWECIITLWYDISVLWRQLDFKPATPLYWVTKYSTLAFSISANIMNGAAGFLVTQQEINCQANQYIMDLASNLAIVGSSGLLLFRAVDLWKCDLKITTSLAILYVAQVGFFLHNSFVVKSMWSANASSCVPLNNGMPWLRAEFVYAMVFDFFILAAAASIFVKESHSLWDLLFSDGLAYFLCPFALYFICTVVGFTPTGDHFPIIWNHATTILVSILACRLFVRYTGEKTDRPGATPKPATLPPSGDHIEFRRPQTSTFGGALSSLWRSTFRRDPELELQEQSGATASSSGPATTLEKPVSLPGIMEGGSESDIDIEAQSEKAKNNVQYD